MTATLLSVVVPAFNARDYLSRALDGFTASDSRVEVIVVDDGSSDDTAAIAEQYVNGYPSVFRLVRQPNGGHGGAIEKGVARATGRYIKVLDADDWLARGALAQVLDTLEDLESSGGVDALFTDYVHDRVGKSNRVARFENVFPAHRRFGWDATGRFDRRQYLMMHAVIFRRELLLRSGLHLPRHTFYVDSLYVLTPLSRVRRMYYLPVTLYHYFIGREGQSVDAEVMVRRVDQHMRVTKLALQTLPSPTEVASGQVPIQLYSAMLHYVQGLCAVTSATLARGGTRQHVRMRREFWRDVSEETPWIYARVRRSFVAASSNLPGQAGRRVTSLAYHVARKVVGFS